MIEKRHEQADEAPRRRYDDVKAASRTAADRIAKATAELRQACQGVDDSEPERMRA